MAGRRLGLTAVYSAIDERYGARVAVKTVPANLVTAIQMHDIASAMLSAPSDGK